MRSALTRRAVVALVSAAGLAGVAQGQRFQESYGDQTRERNFSLDRTRDGGWVTAGFRFLGTALSEEFLITKHKRDGGIEWQVGWGGPGSDIAYSVQQTSDGGYIVAGESTSFGATMQIILLRLEADGTTRWVRQYTGTVGTDPIHSPFPGVALDQERETGHIAVIGNSAGAPVLFRTLADGTLLWHNLYVAMVPNATQTQLAFTDVEFTPATATGGTAGGGGDIVVSGTVRYVRPFAGGIVTERDAYLLATTPIGAPVWSNRYSYLIDRDSPNFPVTDETGDGLDINAEGVIALNGRTDYGIAGADGTHLLATTPAGGLLWSTRFDVFDTAGVPVAFVDHAYAAVEFDRENNIVHSGDVVREDALNAYVQRTLFGGAPDWFWAYGGDLRSESEAVIPDFECGYGSTGSIFSPPNGLGLASGDFHLVKSNDRGEVGCAETRLFATSDMVRAPERPTPVVFDDFGQERRLDEPAYFADSNVLVFCFDDRCDRPCPADYNGDTVPGDVFDLFDFLADLDMGLDYNGDTVPGDIFDLFDFLAVLDMPCP